MVDTISLLVSHALLVLTAWRLLWRDDLDSEDADKGRFLRRKKPGA